MNKAAKINLLSTIIVIGFIFGVFYHYFLGAYLSVGKPYNSFVYPSNYALCDLFGIFPYLEHFNPYKKIVLWGAYFPLTYLLMFPFIFIKNKVICYLLYSLPFIIYLTFMNIRAFTCKTLTGIQNFQNIFIITLASYPVLYILDKGNFDMYLFILFGLCVYAFKSEKYLSSAVLLGVMNAMKPFTVLFLLLFLKQKKYKEFFISIIVSTILVILGFLIFKGEFFHNIKNFLAIQNLFRTMYALSNIVAIGFSSSIFMPMKIVALSFSHSKTFIENFVMVYDYLVLGFSMLTMFFIWREKSYWRQLTLLICNFILLPYCTYDYKLLFFLIPIWLFVNEEKEGKFDMAYVIIFSLLFIPKSIIINLVPEGWTSLSAIINPIIMVILCMLIIYEQYLLKKRKV